jgi:hypothetical protein
MKNQKPIRNAISWSLFILLFFSARLSTAQMMCPYPINNSSQCKIVVSYTIYGSTCSQLSTGSIGIPGGSTANLTCPTGAFDIQLSVLYMDVSTCTPLSQSPSVIGAGLGCSSNSSSSTLTWDASNPSCTCSFNPPGYPSNFSMNNAGATLF